MSEPKRPLKVFLCHAHADRDAVRVLYARLVNDGVDVWNKKRPSCEGLLLWWAMRNSNPRPSQRQ